ncbi:MAG: hypothetical protein QXI19_12980 [Candidatus Caldarchaeum sp.]
MAKFTSEEFTEWLEEFIKEIEKEEEQSARGALIESALEEYLVKTNFLKREELEQRTKGNLSENPYALCTLIAQLWEQDFRIDMGKLIKRFPEQRHVIVSTMLVLMGREERYRAGNLFTEEEIYVMENCVERKESTIEEQWENFVENNRERVEGILEKGKLKNND